jgi:hypothetical protein
MSADSPAPDSQASVAGAGDKPADNRVFVEIPKAGPGQGYRAPKTLSSPLLDSLSRLLIWIVCAALVVAPAFVVGLICFAPGSHALQFGFAWLWIVMFMLTESIGLFSAIGIYREATGISGSR